MGFQTLLKEKVKKNAFMQKKAKKKATETEAEKSRRFWKILRKTKDMMWTWCGPDDFLKQGVRTFLKVYQTWLFLKTFTVCSTVYLIILENPLYVFKKQINNDTVVKTFHTFCPPSHYLRRWPSQMDKTAAFTSHQNYCNYVLLSAKNKLQCLL